MVDYCRVPLKLVTLRSYPIMAKSDRHFLGRFVWKKILEEEKGEKMEARRIKHKSEGLSWGAECKVCESREGQ